MAAHKVTEGARFWLGERFRARIRLSTRISHIALRWTAKHPFWLLIDLAKVERIITVQIDTDLVETILVTLHTVSVGHILTSVEDSAILVPLVFDSRKTIWVQHRNKEISILTEQLFESGRLLDMAHLNEPKRLKQSD